MSAKSSSSVS